MTMSILFMRKDHWADQYNPVFTSAMTNRGIAASHGMNALYSRLHIARYVDRTQRAKIKTKGSHLNLVYKKL